MILVTGATGNVGGEVVPALLAAGHEVRALVRDGRQATEITLGRAFEGRRAV